MKNILNIDGVIYHSQSEVDAIREDEFAKGYLSCAKYAKEHGTEFLPTDTNLNANDTGKEEKPLIPIGSENIEVFHISPKEAFIGFKLPNGNFEYVQIPFNPKNFNPEQPTNDNAFAWDYNTAKELVKYSATHTHGLMASVTGDYTGIVNDFVKSKQSEPLHTDKTWWQKLGVKFDGKFYNHPKTNSYDNLDKVMEELNSLRTESEPLTNSTKENKEYISVNVFGCSWVNNEAEKLLITDLKGIKRIHPDKFDEIKQAVQDALNGGVVRVSKSYWKQLHEDFDRYEKQMDDLVQKKVYECYESVWNEARATHPMAGMKYETFQDFKNHCEQFDKPKNPSPNTAIQDTVLFTKKQIIDKLDEL